MVARSSCGPFKRSTATRSRNAARSRSSFQKLQKLPATNRFTPGQQALTEDLDPTGFLWTCPRASEVEQLLLHPLSGGEKPATFRTRASWFSPFSGQKTGNSEPLTCGPTRSVWRDSSSRSPSNDAPGLFAETLWTKHGRKRNEKAKEPSRRQTGRKQSAV